MYCLMELNHLYHVYKTCALTVRRKQYIVLHEGIEPSLSV